MPIRKIILNIHLVAGLIAGVFLFLLGLSGSILVFENEIDHTLNSELTYVRPAAAPLSLSQLKVKLEQAYPGYTVYGFTMGSSNNLAWGAVLATPDFKDEKGLAFNPYTGNVLGTDEEQNRLINMVHQFHTHLLMRGVGSEIVGWASVFLLLLSIRGLILWWPRKVFHFNRHSSERKFLFELHNSIGIYSSAVLLIFSITGIAIYWENAASAVLDRITGSHSQEQPARSNPTAAGAKQLLDPDQLVAIARQTVPNAPVTWLQLSTGPRTPVRITMKFPEDHTPAGRTRILLDAYSGKVLQVVNSRTAPAAYKIMKLWNREIHTGDIFGWPTRVLACLFSLSPPLLTITGPLMWWTRRRRAKTMVTKGSQQRG
ncbi:MAG TPA: PepSY-associated TM helix domain-containing protein [Blastocatellia bacterium]|nr:PepSY-associated TM helix domain-containing protein [Blastocatellia bacterium]